MKNRLDWNDPRIEKLPKWAQAMIGEMRSTAIQADRAMHEKFDAQPERPDYHDHEFFTRDYVNGEVVERRYAESNMHLRLDNGMEVDISPRDNGVTFYFDNRSRSDGDVVVIPGASNCLRLQLAEIKK